MRSFPAFLILLPSLSFAALDHPRTFFAKDDLPAIRAKAQTAEGQVICKPVLNAVLAKPRRPLLDDPPPKYTEEYTTNNVDNDVGSLGAIIQNLAFAYVVTGDKKYLNKEREYFKEIAGWPTWYNEYAPPKSAQIDLYFGKLLAAVSLSYDWLYDDLPPDEREAIHKALANWVDYGVKWLQADRKTGWEKFAYNHWAVIESGLGIATLVLEGEDPRSDGWMKEIYQDRLPRVQGLLVGIKDGTWWEGTQYQGEEFSMLLPFLYLSAKLKDPAILPRDYFCNLGLWRVYNYVNDSNNPLTMYSDQPYRRGKWSALPDPLLRFSARLGNRYAEWLHGIYNSPELSSGRDDGATRCSQTAFEFFFWDPSVKPMAPDDPSAPLPLNHTFSDLEVAIWRTGWGDQDLAFALKSGPYKGGRYATDRYKNKEYPFETCYNMNGHFHSDAGTFYLNRGSRILISEVSGYGVIESKYHNVVLVDGQNQFFSDLVNYFADTDARLESVREGPDFNFLVSDQTARYRGFSKADRAPTPKVLTKYKRYVLFSRPDYFIMVDDIHSASSHKYDWLCHFSEAGSNAQLTAAGDDWLKAPSGDQVVGLKVLAPSGYRWEAGIHSDKPDKSKADMNRYYADITPATNTADTRFVTVFYPTYATNWADRPEVSLLDNTAQGVLIRTKFKGAKAGATQDTLVKCVAADGMSAGQYHMTGASAGATRDSQGALQQVFLTDGKSFADGNKTLLESPKKAIAVEAKYAGPALALYSTDDLKDLKVYAPGVGTDKVTVNGKPTVVTKQGDYLLFQ